MIILLRHGHAEHNDNKELVHGVVHESALTPKGVEQSKQAAQYLAQHHAHARVITSPTMRTKHTAKRIAEALNTTVFEDKRLIELSHGEWQGLKREDVFTPERNALFATHGHTMSAPGGESLKEVEERMMEWLSEQEDDVIAVTHAGAMRCLLRAILDIPFSNMFSIHIDNCGMIGLEKQQDTWNVLFVKHAINF